MIGGILVLYIFVALLCLPLSLMALDGSVERMLIIGEWKEAYSEIFGNKSDEALTDSEVLERVMFMKEESENVCRQRSITTEMRDTVTYWYDALINTGIEHCHFAYLRGVKNQMELIKNPPSVNLATMFSLVHRFLIEICNDIHEDVRSRMRRHISFDVFSELINIQIYYEMWQDNEMPPQNLIKEMIKHLGIKKNSPRDQIVSAWKYSPCGLLQSLMRTSEFESFYDYVAMAALNGLEGLKFCPVSTNRWVRIVNACDQLDLIKVDLIKNYKSIEALTDTRKRTISIRQSQEKKTGPK